MKTKLFEIRDEGAFIPVVAIKFESMDENEGWLLRRAGYGYSSPCVFLGKLATGGAEYDPYAWTGGARTMPTAHIYITDNWDKLTSGDVVCVEHILGERETPKVSERLETL